MKEAGGSLGVRTSGDDVISATPLDLRGQDLRGDQLATRRLAGADLRNSNLEGVHLDGREMTGARLDGANLSGASLRATTLEDSSLVRANVRFADLTDAVLESADLSRIDGWGVKLDRAELRDARLDFAELEEASLTGVSAPGASFRGATLKHSSLVGARLPNADLRGAVLQHVDLTSADLSRAHLEDVDLSTCSLTGVLMADAWLDRTHIAPAQLVIVGEELHGDWESAARAYRSLERNFESLGESDAASRAYRRRRRAQKNASFARFRTAVGERKIGTAGRHLASWLGDTFAELTCDYGESIPRVIIAEGFVLVVFAFIYAITGTVARGVGENVSPGVSFVDHLVFSLSAMVSGTGGSDPMVIGVAGTSIAGVEAIVAIGLAGLLGFVVGNRIRR